MLKLSYKTATQLRMSAGGHQLWWQPGESGRGLVAPDGSIHTWPHEHVSDTVRPLRNSLPFVTFDRSSKSQKMDFSIGDVSWDLGPLSGSHTSGGPSSGSFYDPATQILRPHGTFSKVSDAWDEESELDPSGYGIPAEEAYVHHTHIPYDEDGPFLYHRAPTEDRARIMQHGLIPSSPRVNPTWRQQELEGYWVANQPTGVYMTKAEDPFVKQHDSVGSDVWKVRVHPEELEHDPVFYDDEPYNHFYSPHAVHPSRIEMHEPFENRWEDYHPEHKWPDGPQPESTPVMPNPQQPLNEWNLSKVTGPTADELHLGLDIKMPERYARRRGSLSSSRTAMAMDPDFLQSWIAEHGPYMYHGAHSRDGLDAETIAAKIQREGLQPNQRPAPTPEDYPEPLPHEIANGFYDYNDDNRHGELADILEKHWLHPRQNHVFMTTSPETAYGKPLFRVDLRKLDPRNLNADDDWLRENDAHSEPLSIPPKTLGEEAHERDWGSNPEDTHESLQSWGVLGHRGPIPPHALERIDVPHMGRTAGELSEEDFPFMREGCGDYAEALHFLDPRFKYGMHYNTVKPEHAEDPEEIGMLEPVHAFVHDDKHAYDAQGQHPLEGYNPFNAERTELDVHPSRIEEAEFRQESGEEEPWEHIARRFPVYRGHAYAAMAGYDPKKIPLPVLDYTAMDDDDPNLPATQWVRQKYPSYFNAHTADYFHLAPTTERAFPEDSGEAADPRLYQLRADEPARESSTHLPLLDVGGKSWEWDTNKEEWVLQSVNDWELGSTQPTESLDEDRHHGIEISNDTIGIPTAIA